MSKRKTLITSELVTARDPKGRQAVALFKAVYNKRRLDPARAQLFNERGDEFQAEVEKLIDRLTIADDRFEEIGHFFVVVPQDYDHATRLGKFGKEHRKEFSYYNDAITDENYRRATTKLVPDRKFKVKIFQIKETVSSEDCLVLLRSQKALLVGAQGASLAYEQGKDQLPVGFWSLSFDEKDALWQDADGYHGVPRVDRYSGGDFRFCLAHFEGGWCDGYCLLCFCDVVE